MASAFRRTCACGAAPILEVRLKPDATSCQRVDGSFDLHVRERERPLVGQLRDALVGRPVAVRRLGLDANQDRLVAALRRLQRRRELEGVARHDAIVVVGGGDQRRPDSRCRP